MAHAVHDTFTKKWMQQMLSDLGDVNIEVQIDIEVRKIDVVFFPDAEAVETLPDLGLLGLILMQPAAVEAFRNAVPDWEIHNCRTKRFALHNQLAREAKKHGQPFPKHQYPSLWITTPTFSKTLQKAHRAEILERWGPGIYFLSESDRTAIIAIHQLPKTPETLFLRLLGKGSVQAEAVQELMKLDLEHPYRQTAFENISILRINLEMSENKTKQIKEVIMNLSPAYEKWRQETLTEGEARGEARGETRGKKIGQEETRFSIAKNMLQEGADVAFVAKVTGLSVEEVELLGEV
jgi:hypothetical protein